MISGIEERLIRSRLHAPAPEERYNQKAKHLHVTIAIKVRR